MATNRIHEDGRNLSVICSHPASPSSGNPVRFGNMTGVASTDERTDGDTSVDFGPAVYDLSVKAENDSGNNAVVVGDMLFYVDADVGDGTGYLNKKVSGYFFGFAQEAITSGTTSTINVKTDPGPGPGTLDIPAGAIDTAELAADAVTGAKIEDDAVNSEHIATGAVDLGHMSVNSVDSDQYVDGSIDLAHMSAESVDSDQYVDGSVDLEHLSIPKYGVITQSVAFGEFTDVDTKGHIDLTTPMPKGAIPLGCKFVVTTGFTGDTTAIVQAGVSGDTDRFTLNVDQSVLAAATVGSLPATDGADGMAAAQTIRVTVTGGADFTSISAGVMVVSVFYIETE